MSHPATYHILTPSTEEAARQVGLVHLAETGQDTVTVWYQDVQGTWRALGVQAQQHGATP